MPTIGIDLGTTNSLVAYWDESGPAIIPNVFGENMTPSVVSVDEAGQIYVGKIAKERLITHPQLTAANFKRYMGTEKVFRLGKYSFRPEELSSFVLRSLKEDAEVFFKQGITDAVISVPAYFSDAQRKATKRAGELAGLKVERLISEPTAAAISYGLHQERDETRFLVFDLGGGTFDVSILELFAGIMEVKSVAGDNFLGGEDFTDALASLFLSRYKIDVQSLDFKARSAIYKQAESCKRELTVNQTGKMVYGAEDNPNELTLNRMEYENLVAPLLLRLRQPIERALRDASLLPNDLDAVILVGGATRMPVVRSVVSKMFGVLPYSNINPDETIAMGAAIQAALKERNEALKEVILTDVCPYTLGTVTGRFVDKNRFEGGFFCPIIERNTPIPVSRSETFQTVFDNQTKIKVAIYQGENRKVENNIKLGELELNVPPAPAGQQTVDVRYTYDINGILEVEVIVEKTGVKKRMIIEKNPGSMTQEEIDKRFAELQALKIHPRDRAENKLLMARGERLYEESLGETREYIAGILSKFEVILAQQDEKKIKKTAEDIKKILDEIEGRYEF